MGFAYAPSTGIGGAAQTTVSPVSANYSSLGIGIKYVAFVETKGGYNVYRELAVNGTPSTDFELSFGNRIRK